MRIRAAGQLIGINKYEVNTTDFDAMLDWCNDHDVTVYGIGVETFWSYFLVIHNEELFILRWM